MGPVNPLCLRDQIFSKTVRCFVKEEDLKYFVNVTEKFKSTLIHGLLDKSKNYTCR